MEYMDYCIDNLFQKITEHPDLVEWVKKTGPPYMFLDDPHIDRIAKLVYDDGHSGASFAACLLEVHRRLKDL